MTTIADTQPTRFTKGETVISTRNANKFTFVSYLPDRDANGYDSVVRRDTHFMLADSRVLTAKPKLFSVGGSKDPVRHEASPSPCGTGTVSRQPLLHAHVAQTINQSRWIRN